MQKPSIIKSKLISVIKDAEANSHSFVKNPNKDMTRNRKLGFLNTVMLTLSFEDHSLNSELLNFFTNKDILCPSKSAYVQQRNKFNDELFPALFHNFNKQFPFRKTYEDFHLIACDGSDINLPTDSKDKEYFVKYPRSDGGYYQMHFNALYDILEKRYIDGYVQPRPQINETQALIEMIHRNNFKNNSVFIADRGYPSFNLLAHIIESNKFFLIRAKSPQSNSLLKNLSLPAKKEFDAEVEFFVTRSKRKIYNNQPNFYKYLPPGRKFDFIDIKDHESTYKFKFRVVCIELSYGTKEYLLTNLPGSFSMDKVKKLYSMRWGIESSFRTLKYALSLVYFHSKKRDFIIQELYARLIMYNFSSLISQYVSQCEEFENILEKRNGTYIVSMNYAVKMAKMVLVDLKDDEEIKKLLLSNLTQVRKYINTKPRKVKSQSAKPLNKRL